jgi:hypothetical protein
MMERKSFRDFKTGGGLLFLAAAIGLATLGYAEHSLCMAALSVLVALVAVDLMRNK